MTLTAYGVYLVLAVGFCSYMLVQLGLSMTCSSLPGDAREVGAYICGVIEARSKKKRERWRQIVDIVFISVP